MKKIMMIALTVILAVSVFAGCAKSGSNSVSQKIDMNGSTTIFPIAQKEAEVYMNTHPNVDISVEGTGTGNGIAALIDSTTDIATASRQITKDETSKANANGVNPYETTIALDALSIIVNPQNPVNALTADQVRSIFIGNTTNWKDVGGPDMQIVVVTRDSSSGTYSSFLSLALKTGDLITNKAIVQSSSQTVKNTIATTKGAIGYDGLGFVDSSVKAISYNGVIPSKATASDKSYKLSRYLYLYTNKSPTGAVKDFIDFILSPDGQSIVDDVGFIKIK
jgi:phosphate transport system substrate-binding protein